MKFVPNLQVGTLVIRNKWIQHVVNKLKTVEKC